MNFTKVTIGVIVIVVLLYLCLMKFSDGRVTYRKAVANLTSADKNPTYKNVHGTIYFDELADGSTRVHGSIRGLPPGKHGFHIHEYGDTTDGCKSMGGHFNPTKKQHGDRKSYTYRKGVNVINQHRHVGDLGNIEADKEGIANIDFEDSLIKLRGATNIVGRGIVVHRDKDDLGHSHVKESRINGNSGPAIACGVISITD